MSGSISGEDYHFDRKYDDYLDSLAPVSTIADREGYHVDHFDLMHLVAVKTDEGYTLQFSVVDSKMSNPASNYWAGEADLVVEDVVDCIEGRARQGNNQSSYAPFYENLETAIAVYEDPYGELCNLTWHGEDMWFWESDEGRAHAEIAEQALAKHGLESFPNFTGYLSATITAVRAKIADIQFAPSATPYEPGAAPKWLSFADQQAISQLHRVERAVRKAAYEQPLNIGVAILSAVEACDPQAFSEMAAQAKAQLPKDIQNYVPQDEKALADALTHQAFEAALKQEGLKPPKPDQIHQWVDALDKSARKHALDATQEITK